jgi:hypothetical protein
MINAMKVYTILTIAGVSYFGCSRKMPVVTGPEVQEIPVEEPEVQQIPEDGPGAFGISMLQGLSKLSGTKNKTDNSVVSFDLGSIGGSTAFYFIQN